jgi:hypothetical protein
VYGDVDGTSLDLDTLQIDDGVSLAAWLAAVSTTGVDEEEVWRSYEEQAEEQEVLDEGVSFAMMDADGQKEFKERNRARREVLPAMELAAKAGFEADDNSLSTLQSFNQGTFNVRLVNPLSQSCIASVWTAFVATTRGQPVQ